MGSTAETMAARRVTSIGPLVASAPSGQAEGDRAALRPEQPPRRGAGFGVSLKVVSSAEPPALDVEHEAAGERRDGDHWLKLPRGIVLGVLLAIPFWGALAVWLLW